MSRSAGLVRIAVVVLAAVTATTGCSSSDDAGESPASAADAIAAYVPVGDDRARANEVFFPLTMAAEGEPAEDAGFIRGLRAAFAVSGPGDELGIRVVFQSYASEADRERLRDKARVLAVGPVEWLAAEDLWPDCSGDADCLKVGDTPSLP